MTARPRRLPRREHGFVLVGVIIFVLALTILALSLYGLSGFEAQFLEQNVAHDQAFYRAESGQELVKELLSQTLPDSSYYLQNAHKAIGIEGVVDATAWQMNGANPITAGLVDWSQPVYINVKAAYGGETRTVEGKFIGAPRRDPYQQLITSSNWIQYGENNRGLDNANLSRIGTTTLTGRVWQDSTVAPDVSWQNVVNWVSGAPVIRNRAPIPLAHEFMAQREPQAQALQFLSLTSVPLVIDMTASQNQPFACFTGPQTTPTAATKPLGPYFTLYDEIATTVNVTGVCVWMFDEGVRFDQRVQIKGGGPENVLIIVAGPNNRDQLFGDFRDWGIWFFGGLDIQPNVTVYLVSNGVVDIEDFQGSTTPPPGNHMDHLAVFANGFFFLGPLAPPLGTTAWTMAYDSSSMDALTSQLEALGALPVPSGVANGTFTLVPGSWREP